MRPIAITAVAAVLALAVVVAFNGSHGPASTPYKIQAIFDDASFAVPGEDVRVAGANVGSISGLGVTAANRAAVTLLITDRRFAPFYANATCAIRPQSLIGEEYVDCNPGTSNQSPLPRIERGPDAGSYYLPVTHTSSPIDSDIVQDISTEPVRQSLSVIINELGTGLAARGSDLNAVIHRANPALGYTDQVLKVLASQNKVLARLAVNSDAVLKPLAKVKRQITGFIVGANRTSVASAARAVDIARTFRLFPAFLTQLRPLLANLQALADQGTPLMNSLGQSATALGRQFAELTPFAAAARTSLIDLGSAAQQSQPYLVATQPLAQRLLSLGQAAEPTAVNLKRLTTSLDTTGGFQQLMALLFNGATAGNGFDSLGHFVRDEPIVSTCTNYAASPIPDCSSNFTKPSAGVRVKARVGASSGGSTGKGATASDPIVAAAVNAAAPHGPSAASLHGLLGYLLGGAQ